MHLSDPPTHHRNLEVLTGINSKHKWKRRFVIFSTYFFLDLVPINLQILHFTSLDPWVASSIAGERREVRWGCCIEQVLSGHLQRRRRGHEKSNEKIIRKIQLLSVTITYTLTDDVAPHHTCIFAKYDMGDNISVAMMILQVESNGTVLSTNWKEVGTKKVEGSPPEGMEVKRWEYWMPLAFSGP